MRRAGEEGKDYTTSFTADQSAEQIFAAINDVRGWWSGENEGNTDKLGQFTYHYQDVHRCKIKVTEFVPGKRVVWRVLDSYFNFTQIAFGISRNSNQTEVRFAHLGLIPEFECFDVCSNV